MIGDRVIDRPITDRPIADSSPSAPPSQLPV
jgi:hypothetical protein